MSAEATGDCWRNSPFRVRAEVAQMLVHLAIADVVNDLHEYRFWMKQDTLAEKSMASVRTVARALATMLEDGWLTVLTPGGGRGNPTEYRYHLGGNHAMVSAFGAQTMPPETRNHAMSDIAPSTNPRDTNGVLSIAEPADGGFAVWYEGYPRPVGKAAARKAFGARRRDGATIGALTLARDNYAVSVRDADPKYIKHPATFLAKDGPWTEWLSGDPDAAAADPESMQRQLSRAQWTPTTKGAANGNDRTSTAAQRRPRTTAQHRG